MFLIHRDVHLGLLPQAHPFAHGLQIRIRGGDAFPRGPVDDAITLHPRGVDPVEAVRETELVQRGDAPGLEELADDPVWLAQVPLQQEDFASGRRERVGERAAGYAGADDDDFWLNVV